MTILQGTTLRVLFYCGLLLSSTPQEGDSPRTVTTAPPGVPPTLEVPDATVESGGEMKPYTDRILGTELVFSMLPIPAGKFLMGSPTGEAQRKRSEGPQSEVEVGAFWMGRYEVTWDEYHIFMHKLDRERRAADSPAIVQDAWADAVSRPTPPYMPMDFEMGVEGFPAICMTQFAAKQYTKWLSMKTGRFYRLPTEAEWEYACRAGTQTAYSFGNSAKDLDDYAWHFENSDDTYHPVGQKKPNPFGLHDMHGNVAEWVLDRLDRNAYAENQLKKSVVDPVSWPLKLYPRVVRGGSWDDDADRLRSAARRGSKASWKVQDPQLPKSIWYHTDAIMVGFRVVRPLVPPPLEERARYWETDLESIAEIEARQRLGER